MDKIGDVARRARVSMCTVAAFGICAAMAAPGQSDSKPTAPTTVKGQTDWPVYNGSAGNSHYSKLRQINTRNVAKLKQAWSYDTGEKGGLETSPIIVDGVLYAYTPTQEVIALNAATGKQIWKFNSGMVGKRPERAVAYWQSGNDKRIFAAVTNYIYALDATTGKPILTFGVDGRIDLRENLRGETALQSVAMTSPVAIYKDLIIAGDAVPETLPCPPGDIRAYDAVSGKLRWTFHTIPHPGEFGYDTWPKNAWTTNGSANNWTGMAVDAEHGIVYVPTGSAATDWYGADRIGDDLFANSLIALKAETGERIWHFQGVRHDLWDRDFPSPPTLVTVRRNGKNVEAVAQTSKQGYLFLFNRLNGTPLFPIQYRKYPASDVPGEVTAAEQPYPTKPAPFSRQLLTEDLLTERTPEAHQWALEHFRTYVTHGQFTPNSVGKNTIMFPGFDGGAEWGGSAFDPETGILYLNANDVALTESLVKHSGSGGRATYMSQCSLCHGENLAGSPPAIPALVGIEKKMSADDIGSLIADGKGRMPGVPGLAQKQRDELVSYLMNGQRDDTVGSGPVTYDSTGYHKFLDPEGYPAVATPWGTLNAIDLNTGKYVWKNTLGQYPELVAKGMKDTGSENYGGPVVTAGGLLIIAATVVDKKIRIFDKRTGKLLWETVLPFPANATPATYEVNGRQYIVIAAGGGRDPKMATGGVYVAFALPE